MQILDTELNGVKLIHCDRQDDCRGEKEILLNASALKEGGLDFCVGEQRLYRIARAHTLFGIHFQADAGAQGKIITLIAGQGIDYAVDLDRNSPTYRKWISFELSGQEPCAVYIPQGYGHAFYSLEDNTVQLFTLNGHPASERIIHYLDPEIGLRLPGRVECIADRDRNAPFLSSLNSDPAGK